VRITADVFRDRNLIQRHRLVYDAVGDMMQRDIHALSIDARTPEE
jgi:stress-induced morphogen